MDNNALDFVLNLAIVFIFPQIVFFNFNFTFHYQLEQRLFVGILLLTKVDFINSFNYKVVGVLCHKIYTN